MIRNDPVLHKVTAFVTRGEGERRELLVFRHGRSGVQVPAGTVEAGEPIEAAVLREVAEETGLVQVEIVARLGTIQQPLEPGQMALLRRVQFRSEPAVDAPLLDFTLRRGHIVRVRQSRGEYVEAVYEVYDNLEAATPTLIPVQAGWVPRAALTARIERHHFHLRPTAPAPDRWTVFAEGKYDFQLYWAPLAENPGLIAVQDAWLASVRDHLAK